jgi:hypothetical protein
VRRGLGGEYPNPVGGTKDTQLARALLKFHRSCVWTNKKQKGA